MELTRFWELIERSARGAGDPAERERWLVEALGVLPLAELVDFEIHLDTQRSRINTWQLYGAARLLLGGECSDDSFFYFRNWLVGLGRDDFEQVAADPDALAATAAIARLAGMATQYWDGELDWPNWEGLGDVAGLACDLVAGGDGAAVLAAAVEARGYDLRLWSEPAGEDWDFDDPAELARRYPRMWTAFPLDPEPMESGGPSPVS